MYSNVADIIMSFPFLKKVWRLCRYWRDDLRAVAAKYFVTREVVKVLALTHARELADTPRNDWAVVRSKQLEEIQAVKSGKVFDIVDRRSWPFPMLPEALHRLNQPVLKNCFSADTEVLTKRGWVMWPKVTQEDVFATYNIEKETQEWQRSQKIFKYWHEGEMYQFQNKFVDLLVTPDHLMLGRFRKPSSYQNRHTASYNYSKIGLIRAKKVKEWQAQYSPGIYTFEAPLTAKWPGKFPKSYDPKSGTIKIECQYPGTTTLNYQSRKIRVYDVPLMDWIRFLGIYIAEGSCDGTLSGLDLSSRNPKPHYVQAIQAAADPNFYDKFKQRGHGYRVRISQTKETKHNLDVSNKVRELLHKLPWMFDEDLNGFEIRDKTLHSILFSLGNSYTKHIPRWVKRLPPEYVSEFIKWACMGDGNGGSDKRTYFTVSKQLADDMQELFQVSGAYAHVSSRYNNRGVTEGSCRVAPIYSVSEHLMPFGSVGRPESVDYKGYVYCVAIPNQTVYVRRNGIPSWCGRTPYNLRRFSETPIPRRAINLVKNAVLGFKWEIVPLPEFENEKDLEIKAEREQRIKIATKNFKHPNGTGDSDRDLLEMMLEDFLTVGSGAAEYRLTPDVEMPFKMWAVDASTIRIFMDWTESTPDRPRYAQMTGLKGERGIVTFLSDELMYIRDNIRTATPFGLGRLEVCFNICNSFLGAQDMAGRAGSDQVHKTWLWWETALNPAHLQIIRRHIINELEGQAKVSLVAGAKAPQVIDVHPVTPDDLLIEWQKYCTSIIAIGFDMNGQDLGLEENAPRATSQVLADSTWKFGIVPVATRFQATLTRQWLHNLMGWTDLQFRYKGLEDPDPITRTVIHQRLWSMSSITPETICKANDLPIPPGPFSKLTLFEQQLLLVEVQAKLGGRASGSPGGTGAGMGAGMSSGMSSVRPPSTGSLGTGSGSMRFAAVQNYYQQNPQDVSQLSPDMVQLYQELGILDPDSENVMNQMDQRQPGILDQLSDELTTYFKHELANKQVDEVQPSPITSEQRNKQIQRFLEEMHQESLAEKVINRRGVFGPSINQQFRKNPERGKYPRSGGRYQDPNVDRVQPPTNDEIKRKTKGHYSKGKGNLYQ